MAYLKQDSKLSRNFLEISPQLRPRAGRHSRARHHHPEAKREEGTSAEDRRVRLEGRDELGRQTSEEEGLRKGRGSGHR